MKSLNEVSFVIQIITVGVLGYADPGIVVDRLGCCQEDELCLRTSQLGLANQFFSDTLFLIALIHRQVGHIRAERKIRE